LSLDALPVKDKLAALSALSEGFMMSDYEFVAFKEAPKVKPMELHINFNLKKVTASHKKTLQEATTLAEGVNFARWMGDCPGNFMTPDQMAEEAKKAAKGTKMKVTVWNKDRIAKEKMDSLIGVSNGSAQEPPLYHHGVQWGRQQKAPHLLCGQGLDL
jgi:leucyl aminopeptidase